MKGLTRGINVADRYEIIDELGRGGMGVVYKAKDTKLKRIVALKFLSSDLTSDTEANERFIHEAQAASALDHPNIYTVYEIDVTDGQMFIAMAYVEGESLRKKVAKGPLKLDDALNIATQIAVGLYEAHEKGIVHRDIKSSNIVVNEKGQAKIMDFGVAKLEGRTKFTKTGTTMGTIAYMSPEQAKGEKVDYRTDIWSLGVILYEMITGQLPFKGDYEQVVIYSILNEDPELLTALRTGVPLDLERIVFKMLAKDPAGRYQHADEVPVDLKSVKEMSSSIPRTKSVHAMSSETPSPAIWLRWLPWSLFLLMTIIAALALWGPWRSGLPERQNISRVVIPTSRLAESGHVITISPDDSRLVYVSIQDGESQLFLRELDQFTAIPIPDTEGAYSPFFSPDSQWIGFFSASKLKKVSLSGGKSTIICDAHYPYGGGTRGPDDIITIGYSGGLAQVAAFGGEPKVITNIDKGAGEYIHGRPELLPGGKVVLYTIFDGSNYPRHIMAKNLETNEQHPVIEGASSVRYTSSGHLIYVQAGSLLAAPFDLDKLEITGPSVTVSEEILGISFDFSKKGTLIYIEASERTPESMLVWVNRQGIAQPVMDIRRNFVSPRVSPDGKRIVVRIGEEGKNHIWVYDIKRDTLTRVTSEGLNMTCLWAPDGQRVTFNSTARPGIQAANLFWKPTDGRGAAERLTTCEYRQAPLSWSHDGKFLFFIQESLNSGFDIWAMPNEGDHEPFPFLNSPSNEWYPAISPDGLWLAYTSDKSGHYEVFVTPFPGPGGHKQISTQGGREPVWSRDGKELFYRIGDNVMSVDIITDPDFSPSNPKMLFDGKYKVGGWHRSYDIAVDGQHFLMVKASERKSVPKNINVVINWFEELMRLIPK